MEDSDVSSVSSVNSDSDVSQDEAAGRRRRFWSGHRQNLPNSQHSCIRITFKDIICILFCFFYKRKPGSFFLGRVSLFLLMTAN